MIGSPLPCGVALTKREYVARISRSIEYVGVLDTTLSGSRNALTPLMLWYAFERYGMEGFRELVAGCLDVAGVRGRALQRQRHTGVATQELGHRGIPEAVR